ncbi:MAG: ATP-binding protein [Actinomycetota bacterium]|nr:ATP-binding protein [Actinomycetota bacterium]
MTLFSRARTDLPHSPDKWRQALESALKVNDIASSASPLHESVQSMLGVALELLEAEQGSIMLLEDGGASLALVASRGLPLEVPLGHLTSVGEGVAGRVLATGKPLLLGDVDSDAFVNFVPKSRPISSSLVIPMRIQGRGIGVLNLTMTGSRIFTDEDLRVAQLFADQAAGIINRARLHERAEQRSSDLMALVESSKGLLGALDVDSLLRHILDGGTRLAGAKDGFACLFDPETGAIDRGVFRGMSKTVIRDIVADLDVQRAIDSTDVVNIDLPDGSITAVGVRTARGTRGVFVMRADRGLVEDRGDLLRAYAQQCASAVGAAELYSVIERKESELASIIQAVPNPIVLVDSHALIVAINPAAEQLFQVSAMFSAGANVVGGLGHDDVEMLLTAEGEMQSEVVAGNPPLVYKVRVTDVRVPGAPMGRVLIMDDVTSEREIAQTHRDFVAMIGHELRTPLTIIKGFARTLLKRVETASPEDQREALSTIDTKAAHLERLIEDLLYISKIESREATLRVEPVDVATLVNAVSADTIQDFPEREIVLDVADKLSWPCDETKVGLVLRHLIENALKYSENPTPVTVRVSREEDELRVDIIDQGLGLVSSDIPHIFERFHQVDSSSTREQGGTGVGLYLCSQLVKVHGGRIWVDSTWGKGSTFSFSLPSRSTGRKVVRLLGTTAQTA